ncbi:nucleotidyltransferase substrate binding protein (TIGR01987 family) [Alkalibacillus flavidus]|uniref:Nucleotidyltransferase substrate binding protein (TIGR01987 family) n=1 Tax=Alkalibacillus flavidus TaxID=546021 RepID=A0ABV2KXS3_9BACI
MESSKDLRWKQRFEAFEQSLVKLMPYQEEIFENELEEAGFIHFYEMAFDLALQTLIEYLDAQGVTVETNRQAIQEAKDYPFISNHKMWLQALNRYNLTSYIHTEKVKNEVIRDIQGAYISELYAFYDTLKKDLTS